MWKDIVSAVAPVLGTAIGGPFGGLAARAISQAVLGKPDGSEKELAAAIEGASPETLAAIKKADQDFELRMQELGIDLERVHQQDRSSAREREAKEAGAVDHKARHAAEMVRLQHDQHTVECARRYGEITVALDRLSTSVSRVHGRINGYLVAVLGAFFTIILALAAIVLKGG